MSPVPIPADKRAFHCNHCNGQVLIPWNLPATTAPCPHCGGTITSPEPPVVQAPAVSPIPGMPAVVPAPAPVAMPEPQVASPTPSHIPPPRESSQLPKFSSSPVEPAPRQAAAPSPAPAPAAEKPSGGNPKSPLTAILATLLLLCLCAGVATFFVQRLLKSQNNPALTAPAIPLPQHSTAAEDNYIRTGWQRDAFQVLDSFIKGKSPAEKKAYVLDPDRVSSRMEDFYGGGVINDSDTPAETFSVYELSEQDRRRGLFMMVYDQPPQLDMKEFFSPIAPVEVQKGLQEPDILLSTMARIGNFSMEPVRVHAFFKRVNNELKLDWEVFAQTKYRTLQTFVELPETGLIQTFRVFIVEDVPGREIPEPGTRTYRIADPANTSDSARVNVKIDSELGRTLSLINWRGIKDAKPSTRTATIELKWGGTAEKPVLEINRFLCWEFLGLGGTEAQPSPGVSQPTPVKNGDP